MDRVPEDAAEEAFSFEAAEENAGHELTMLSNGAGTAIYFCERCGSIVVLLQSALKIFHQPRGSFATINKCVLAGGAAGAPDKRTLKQKIREMNDGIYERLKDD